MEAQVFHVDTGVPHSEFMTESPQTHVKLSYRLGFLSERVVRIGSKGLNHPEIM